MGRGMGGTGQVPVDSAGKAPGASARSEPRPPHQEQEGKAERPGAHKIKHSHDSRNEHARHTLTMNHQRGWIHADNTGMPRTDCPRWGLPESSWSCLPAWREALGRGAWAIKSSKSHLATFLSDLTPGGTF